ncbi:unnamed protein product [Gemmataceae bacterium]|nr:unnamed protein product [Gemmataceae bacterium]VTT97308.1 unnamed protein product [Gemmataceae bacterium]
MQKIKLPAELTAKLGDVTAPAELCDESGATRAVALPPELYQEMFHVWADSVFDKDSLDRARREPGGMSTPEAIAYLRKVAAEHRKS